MVGSMSQISADSRLLMLGTELWDKVIGDLNEMEVLCELAKVSRVLYKLVGLDFRRLCDQNKIYRMPKETYAEAFKKLPKRWFHESETITLKKVFRAGEMETQFYYHDYCVAGESHCQKPQIRILADDEDERMSIKHYLRFHKEQIGYDGLRHNGYYQCVPKIDQFPENVCWYRVLNGGRHEMIESIHRDYFQIFDTTTNTSVFIYEGDSGPGKWISFGTNVLMDVSGKIIIWDRQTGQWLHYNKCKDDFWTDPSKWSFTKVAENMDDIAYLQQHDDDLSPHGKRLFLVLLRGRKLRLIPFQIDPNHKGKSHLHWDFIARMKGLKC